MDPRKNPYAPGAGTPPPELAGRKDLIEDAAAALDGIRERRSARSCMYYGLRGVGKTVLLKKIRQDAEARGLACVWIEAMENRSLPALIAPPLRAALIKMGIGAAGRAALDKALLALSNFVRVMKFKYHDVEAAIDHKPQRGIADSGDLDVGLKDLMGYVGEAAVERGTAVVLFMDELHYVSGRQLATLITVLHRASQNRHPVTMVAAGLPQIVGQAGREQAYAEQLFQLVRIDNLDNADARDALCIPAEREGVKYDERAVLSIINRTKGNPYLLQEWGKQSWNIADASPIELKDAESASIAALAELDDGFFRVRLDRLSPSEKKCMRAMAELGPGPHRSADMAGLLGGNVTTVAPIRNSLIAKGMIYDLPNGDTAFTAPLFDGFMKRIMPVLERG